MIDTRGMTLREALSACGWRYQTSYGPGHVVNNEVFDETGRSLGVLRWYDAWCAMLDRGLISDDGSMAYARQVQAIERGAA